MVALAGRQSRNPGRWERLKPGQVNNLRGANYSIARQIRAISSSVNASGRLRPSTPDWARTSAPDRPSASATGVSALARVFRRCRKMPRTTFSNRSRRPTSAEARAKPETDHRGGDLRWRAKCTRRKREQALDVGNEGHLDRESAVVAGAGPGQQPVDHFLLQHQGSVREPPALLGCVEELEQDRRRHVVGKVPDHPVVPGFSRALRVQQLL